MSKNSETIKSIKDSAEVSVGNHPTTSKPPVPKK